MTIIQSFKKKSFIFFLAAAALFSSCQKEDNSNPCTVSINSLSGTYRIVSLKYKPNPTAPEQDFMIFFDPCEKDDQVRLNSNKTYDYFDTGVSCNPAGSDRGTWDLIGNKIESDGLIQGEIQRFDCKTLVVFVADLYTEADKLIFTFEKV
jgi:hypothetical protein